MDNIFLNNDIIDTQKEVIFSLGEIIALRSKETSNHVRRVSEYSYLLGKLYGLDEYELNLLVNATPMHDIGKIGIPDSILNKQGNLSENELKEMKKHPIIGHEIFKNSKRNIMRSAAIISKEHHEYWNGSGYPMGLAGEEIHIFSRMVTLVDIFDALSQKRIYKEAWSIEMVVEYIKKQKGKIFDPILSDLFLNNLDKFLDIKNKYPEN